MKKEVLFIVGFLLIVVFAISIYFINGVSATFPPIKKYECNGKIDEFVNKLKHLKTINLTTDINIIDTIGNPKNAVGYEVIINYKSKMDGDTLRYHLKCLTNDLPNSTVIELIGAHDLTHNTGGYGIKADGMFKLLERFNSDVILELKKTGIVLKPM